MLVFFFRCGRLYADETTGASTDEEVAIARISHLSLIYIFIVSLPCIHVYLYDRCVGVQTLPRGTYPMYHSEDLQVAQ